MLALCEGVVDGELTGKEQIVYRVSEKAYPFTIVEWAQHELCPDKVVYLSNKPLIDEPIFQEWMPLKT